MPEIVDVAAFMARLRDRALDRRIGSVEVRDATVLDDVTPDQLHQELTGQRLTDVSQHGTWGGTRIDADPWLTWHFGMTGYVAVDPDEVPDHTRLMLGLEDGGSIAYSCQRRLGRIGLVEDLPTLAQERDLGPHVRDLDEYADEVLFKRPPRPRDPGTPT